MTNRDLDRMTLAAVLVAATILILAAYCGKPA